MNRISTLAIAVGLSLSSLPSCGGEPGGAPKAGPRPQEADPKLVHTFTMPAEKSKLAKADLGTTPADMGDALMTKGGLPGVAHRIVQACAQKNVFGDAKDFAIRFEIGSGGRLTRAKGDPDGAASRCLVAQLQGEAGESFASVPAGAALLRVQLH